VKQLFTVDLKSPQVSLGSIEIQIDKIFGGLTKDDNFIVTYFPVEDAVCIQYRHEFINFYQFWNKANRDAFVKALEEYKEDFTQRNFGKSSKKSKRHYNTVKGYLIWQMFSFTVQANGHPDIDLGYYFKSKMPYFTITQRETYYIDLESSNNNRKTNEIMFYFTRAQADILAGLFNQDFLNGLAPSILNNPGLNEFLTNDQVPESPFDNKDVDFDLY
jgi:hypothetical protein